jgi:hypothetical protein
MAKAHMLWRRDEFRRGRPLRSVDNWPLRMGRGMGQQRTVLEKH